jgi:uncharacterized protein YhhL (DUF1145 family)
MRWGRVDQGRALRLVIGVWWVLVLVAVVYVFPERMRSVRLAAGLVSVFLLVAMYLRHQRHARRIRKQLNAISKDLQTLTSPNQRMH